MQISDECLIYVKNILTNCDGNVYLPILRLPCKGRKALQVARKIAPCDRALIHVCLAHLFLHSGQVLSSDQRDGEKDDGKKDGTYGVVSTASTTTSNPLPTYYCYDISGSNDRGG